MGSKALRYNLGISWQILLVITWDLPHHLPILKFGISLRLNLMDSNMILVTMEMVSSDFTIKPGSVEILKIYLGANIGRVEYSDGSYAWTMSSEGYVKKVVAKIKKQLEKDNMRFNKKLSNPSISKPQPFSSIKYHLELDTSVKCTKEQVTLYQNVIGILRWVVELGRIDIAFEVSLLSLYQVQPQTGHLIQALHVVKYLDIHSKNELAFDPAICQRSQSSSCSNQSYE